MNYVFVEDKWIRGWKAIGIYLGGFKTPSSMRSLQEKWGLPIHTIPTTNEPAIIVSEVNAWLRAFSEASSPFSLRKMTGVALRSHLGEHIGAVKEGTDRVAKKGYKYAKLDWSGGGSGQIPERL